MTQSRMKIAFALVAHYPGDERIWFQQAQSLREAGCETFIVSTRTNHCALPGTLCFDDTGMPKTELIQKLAAILFRFEPDAIICDNPVAIVAARRCKKQLNKQVRIIYDITEWYPSKKNLRKGNYLQKCIKSVVLTCLSYYAAWLADGFILGEYYKARPFRFLLPWKQHIYLSYYADVKQIKTYPLNDISKKCIFFYAGNLTEEKGVENIFNAVSQCAGNFPGTKFILRILSKDDWKDRQLPENLEIQPLAPLPFSAFCEEIGRADLFFDLRKTDFENTRCLPIKLFYYMASGRPVIYSNLKAIRKAVPEIEKIGVLVNPQDTDAIVSHLSRYLNDQAYYREQGKCARILAEQKYGWEHIKQDFVDFIRNY